MFSRGPRFHPSDSDLSESNVHLGIMVAELWHDWFETMSHVAYQAHRTCEVLAETGAPPNGSYGPFSHGSSRAESGMQNSSVDMDKLKECLQSMDPKQAARVMHAVQTMQAMEAMLKKRKARAAESEGTAW